MTANAFYNVTKGRQLVPVQKAGTFWARLIGALFARSRHHCPALWLFPCSAVHTFGMRWAVDLVFMNREMEVMEVRRNVRPFSFPVWCWKAYSVLEIPSGEWDPAGVDVGDRLELR